MGCFRPMLVTRGEVQSYVWKKWRLRRQRTVAFWPQSHFLSCAFWWGVNLFDLITTSFLVITIKNKDLGHLSWKVGLGVNGFGCWALVSDERFFVFFVFKKMDYEDSLGKWEYLLEMIFMRDWTSFYFIFFLFLIFSLFIKKKIVT